MIYLAIDEYALTRLHALLAVVESSYLRDMVENDPMELLYVRSVKRSAF